MLNFEKKNKKKKQQQQKKKQKKPTKFVCQENVYTPHILRIAATALL